MRRFVKLKFLLILFLIANICSAQSKSRIMGNWRSVQKIDNEYMELFISMENNTFCQILKNSKNNTIIHKKVYKFKFLNDSAIMMQNKQVRTIYHFEFWENDILQFNFGRNRLLESVPVLFTYSFRKVK